MAVGSVSFTLLDNSREKSIVAFNVSDLNVINLEGIRQTTNPATPFSLAAAVESVTLCKIIKTQVAAAPLNLIEAYPVDKGAQRELVLVVYMQDTVNFKKSHVSIPGVDWDSIGMAGTDHVDYASPLWAALSAAIELWAQSADGNDVAVLDGRLAGRRA
jgi:hypothetical protein